jgi:hypothetical protein
VISKATPQFWELYRQLPEPIKIAARQAYQKFRVDPTNPGLHLERLSFERRAWSVRVTLNYRAVALRQDDAWIWVWIGNHQEFDRRFPH